MDVLDDATAEIRPTRERFGTDCGAAPPRCSTGWNSGAEPDDPSTRRRSDSVDPPMANADETQDDSVDEALIDIVRDAPIPRLGGFAVMSRTIDIAQAALARHQMAAYPPDVLIEVPGPPAAAWNSIGPPS